MYCRNIFYDSVILENLLNLKLRIIFYKIILFFAMLSCQVTFVASLARGNVGDGEFDGQLLLSVVIFETEALPESRLLCRSSPWH